MKNVPVYLTIKIFETINGLVKIEEFEQWLYSQDELAARMDESLFLELYIFNYKQKFALSIFERMINDFYDQKEITKWMIKSYLKRIITSSEFEDHILSKFYRMWSYDDLSFLRPLAMLHLQTEAFWDNASFASGWFESRKIAREILEKIESEEVNENFDILHFEFLESTRVFTESKSESSNKGGNLKWWHFWK
jgi:hypothetical protein